MAADFSRVRSNPLLDYAGVELKQGAVLLDADANELVAILDRRLRALAGDVLGRATVGANTPDAFLIELDPDGKLLIGRGRLYVDGLLAENHGDANPKLRREFDDLMAETRYEAPVPYNPQPYLRSLPKLPESGRHLVYLDVWNREITHLENPALIEMAVGVETSSRLQTAWQVRLIEVGRDATCSSPDGKWSELIAPSTGRLTTGTYEASEMNDPCELPPSGGFRGLENQLYRVEIQDPGQPSLPGQAGTPVQPGTATFKWSRENVSVGSRVASIVSPNTLELESLGRDDVLRFNTGDWVEIIDDASEQLGVAESRAAGVLRKITVEEATRCISFLPALPDAMVSTASANESNLRVRRWDQKGRVLSASGGGATEVFADLDASESGAIPVPAEGTTLLLENGVTVSFSCAIGSKGFRAGDYWVFAARTADASVELLKEAPPRGIHHHYARLAIWNVGTNPTDCRNLWPPEGGKDRSEDCGCTVCVTPESHKSKLTIQKAVELVMKAGGGTVCLQPGEYVLKEPVRITNARSVRIKGQGPGTRLVAPRGAFSVESSFALAVESLSILTEGDKPAISVASGIGVALHDLVILMPDNRDRQPAAVALSGVIAGLTIRDNLIVAPRGIRALDPMIKNPLKLLIAVALRIENNVLWCERRAVEFAGSVGHLLATTIAGNELLGCSEGGIGMLGFAAAGGSMRIENNSLNVNGPGIQCAVDGAWIQGNKVAGSTQRDKAEVSGSGISLLTGLDTGGSAQCQLLANQVSGFPDAGILIDAPVQDLICKLNIIENCGNGIVMTNARKAGALSIENNHLRDIGSPRAPLDSFIYGINVNRALSATVAGNTLRRIGVNAVRGIAHIAGIVHFAVQRSRVSGNDLSEIGPATVVSGATIGGILLHAPYSQNEISGNHVERDATPAAADDADWSAVGADEVSAKRPIVHAGNFISVFVSAERMSAERMLVLNGPRAFVNEVTLDFGPAAAPVPRKSSITMRGNVLCARGAPSAVALVAGSDIQFGDNRCESVGSKDAVVQLNAGAAVVTSNIVRGGEKTSIRLSATIGRVVVMGNATSADISVNNDGLANTQWAPLNVTF